MSEKKSCETGPKPYIFSRGSCAEHIVFIETFLGGKKEFEMRRRDAPDVIEHASVQVNGGPVYLSDRHKGQYGGPEEGDDSAGRGTQLYLGYDTQDRGHAAWEKAVVAGKSKVIMPLAAQPWGSFYGVFQDPFGTVWAVSCPDESKPRPHGSQTAEQKAAEASPKKSKH